MIKIIRAHERHFADMGWLQTYWLFSFSTYYAPHNVQFGTLRVFNDDVIAPGQGFPLHPHEEMEIVTVMLSGELTHGDSMGHRTTLKAGEVQRLSAGTGMMHSEFNLADQPAHLYQLWIYPKRAGLPPSYEQQAFAPADWKNRLCILASGQKHPGAVTIHADAAIYRCALDAGRTVTFAPTAQRCVLLYTTQGQLTVNGMALGANDQARAEITEPLVLRAVKDADFILIDVAPGK
jgi:redox-sensitive bicupin YhaK (pirin superfamily)